MTALLENSTSTDPYEIIKQLQDELETARIEAASAGEIGMQLLQANEELREQLEKDGESYEQKIEDLLQKNHSLSLKLQMHTKTNEAFEEELRYMKMDLESSYSQRRNLLEQNHNARVSQLNINIEELRNELSLREEQLDKSRSVVNEKEKEISKLKDTIANQSSSSLLYNEASELQHLNTIKQHCQVLEDDLEQQIIAAQEAREEREIYQSKVSELERLLKEKERLAFEWYNSLKETQEEITVLRANLEQMKVKQLQEDWQTQGNSLFGEVEDRRLQTERDLIKFKVKYESLEKTHQTLRHSYKKLKVDFTALLCRHSSATADTDQVQRLQRALSQRNSELEDLNEKFKQLEEQKASGRMSNTAVDFGDKKVYIQYLEHEQKEMKEKLSSLKRELDLKSTQLIWECKKLSESEAKLHKSERDRARFMNEICRMKLKLQEAMDKQGNGKEQVKSMEKEIELLKQQLQGRIKTGETFSKTSESQENRKKKDSCDKDSEQLEAVKKKKKQRMTINLLEELQKANKSEPEPLSSEVSNTNISDKSLTVDKKISPLKGDDTTLQPVSETQKDSDDKENVVQKTTNSKLSLEGTEVVQEHDEDKPRVIVRHKKIKASESKAKMDEQCKQQ